jgi:hypothetical protein
MKHGRALPAISATAKSRSARLRLANALLTIVNDESRDRGCPNERRNRGHETSALTCFTFLVCDGVSEVRLGLHLGGWGNEGSSAH